MGVTHFEIKLLEDCIERYHPKSVLELGSQNNYTTQNTERPPFMSEWYKQRGIEYTCIDLAGDNGALKLDLAYPLEIKNKYELIFDGGTSEHVVQMKGHATTAFHDGYINSIYPTEVLDIKRGYYECWLNKHQLLYTGCEMISVNPMTGMWEGHGYTYLGKDFYTELVKISGYKIIETGLNGATGNWETGVNVYGVIKKNSQEFPTFEEFSKLPIFNS